MEDDFKLWSAPSLEFFLQIAHQFIRSVIKLNNHKKPLIYSYGNYLKNSSIFNRSSHALNHLHTKNIKRCGINYSKIWNKIC